MKQNGEQKRETGGAPRDQGNAENSKIIRVSKTGDR